VNRSDRKASPVPPLLLTAEQAAATLGVGRTYIYALIRDERLRSIRLGRSRRIPCVCLVDFVESLRRSADEPA
jgi:excisionase family DNA binding protein